VTFVQPKTAKTQDFLSIEGKPPANRSYVPIPWVLRRSSTHGENYMCA